MFMNYRSMSKQIYTIRTVFFEGFFFVILGFDKNLNDANKTLLIFNRKNNPK